MATHEPSLKLEFLNRLAHRGACDVQVFAQFIQYLVGGIIVVEYLFAYPGLGKELDDPLYNIAVNDELLLHAVDQRPLADGDIVEIVPTMAGG